VPLDPLKRPETVYFGVCLAAKQYHRDGDDHGDPRLPAGMTVGFMFMIDSSYEDPWARPSALPQNTMRRA